MNVMINESITGNSSVRIEPDGSAAGCFSFSERSSGSVSTPTDDDPLGYDVDYSESKNQWKLGLSGRWFITTTGIELQFDRITHGDCFFDSCHEPTFNLVMPCYGLPAGPKLPRPALLCSVLESERITRLALLIGDAEGAWEFRRGPRKRHEPPEDAVPWILLGADPGLTIGRRGSTMPSTLEVYPVATH
jgi:hypothetical protein